MRSLVRKLRESNHFHSTSSQGRRAIATTLSAGAGIRRVDDDDDGSVNDRLEEEDVEALLFSAENLSIREDVRVSLFGVVFMRLYSTSLQPSIEYDCQDIDEYDDQDDHVDIDEWYLEDIEMIPPPRIHERSWPNAVRNKRSRPPVCVHLW